MGSWSQTHRLLEQGLAGGQRQDADAEIGRHHPAHRAEAGTVRELPTRASVTNDVVIATTGSCPRRSISVRGTTQPAIRAPLGDRRPNVYGKEPCVKTPFESSPAAPPRDAASPRGPTNPVPPPVILAHVFDRINPRMRARMLDRLLRAVGPLALVVVSGGAFAKYVAQARWPQLSVSVEDAALATSGQVYELARYVQQSDPTLIAQLLDALAGDPVTIAALGASIAALAVKQVSSHRHARRNPAI